MVASKYNKEVHEKIVRSIRMGNYVEVAAAAAGIGRRTFYDWLKAGENGDKRYAKLAADVEQAQNDSEKKLLAMHQEAINRAVSMRDPRAFRAAMEGIQWRLERKFPDRWGGRGKVEVSGPEGGAIPIADALRQAYGIDVEKGESDGEG